MVELTKQDNGDLLITVTDKEEFDQLMEREFNDERHYLYEMLDGGRYLGNGWDAPLNIGLTEMPCIAEGAIYKSEESEEPDDYESYWGYPNYMITSYLDELKENGSVIFNKL